MIIERQGDLFVIAPKPLPQRWIGVALSLVGAAMTQTTPYAGSTASFGVAGLFVVFALGGALSPTRRTEIDQGLRQVRIYKGWLWGWSRPHVIEFSDVTGVDAPLSRGGEGPDLYVPQLLLKSGRTQPLLSSTSAAEAENVARAVRHAIFGTS